MNWFRLYDDLLDDPKVQQLTPLLFKQWINVLCLASKTTPRGVLPDITEVAFRLRLTPAKAQAVLDELAAVGLIEEGEGGGWNPHNWFGRQRQSDDIAARVRKHREGDSGNVSVTLQETLLKRTVDRTEKERVKDRQPPLPPDGGDESSSESVFETQLSKRFETFLAQFRSLDPLLDETWLRTTLRRIESDVGALPTDRLSKGLGLAHRQIGLRLKAVTASTADPVHSPRKYAETIMLSELKGQRDGISNANGARAGPVQATARASPDRR